MIGSWALWEPKLVVHFRWRRAAWSYLILRRFPAFVSDTCCRFRSGLFECFVIRGAIDLRSDWTPVCQSCGLSKVLSSLLINPLSGQSRSLRSGVIFSSDSCFELGIQVLNVTCMQTSWRFARNSWVHRFQFDVRSTSSALVCNSRRHNICLWIHPIQNWEWSSLPSCHGHCLLNTLFNVITDSLRIVFPCVVLNNVSPLSADRRMGPEFLPTVHRALRISDHARFRWRRFVVRLVDRRGGLLDAERLSTL